MNENPSVHRAAAEGFASGAETYVRGRPDYPPAALDWLRNALGLEAGKTVVELGAGTGKFTKVLLATGAEVVAVEPVVPMLDRLRLDFRAGALSPDGHQSSGRSGSSGGPRLLSGAQSDGSRSPAGSQSDGPPSPGGAQLSAVAGTAERIPVASGAIDAVVCAQSFHWFATPAAIAEIHRVLKPGGAFGLIWNVRDESVDWLAELGRIFDRHQGDAPRMTSGHWRKLFPAPGFSPLHETRFPHAHIGPPERVIVDRFMSVSFIAALPPLERERLLAQVRDLIARTPSLAGRSEVTVPYVTMAFHCRKLMATPKA